MSQAVRVPQHRVVSGAFALALAETAPPEAPATLPAYWAGPIGYEGEMTGDGRMIAPDALRWELPPGTSLNLRYIREDIGQHTGAETAGRILSIERRPGGIIWASGDFDLSSDVGQEAARQVAEGRQNGVSMDLDDVSFEYRVNADVLAEMNAFWDDDAPEPQRQENPDGTVTVATVSSTDEIEYTTSARICAVTVVAIPAFANAHIDPDEGPGEDTGELPPALAAAAAPIAPPAAWFTDPGLRTPTPLTVTPEGRVYGHLAVWGTCHISHTRPGECVQPPSSPSGYAWFHTGLLALDGGQELPVGHLTMNTGHAAETLGAAATLSHYDDTGTVAADVIAGEDAVGIWVAGALRPGLSAEQIRTFRAAPLSGDWRRVGGALELVAALSVNVPGFPVLRTAGRLSGGLVAALTSAGALRPGSTPTGLEPGEVAALRGVLARERTATARALAVRVARTRVAAFAARRG